MSARVAAWGVWAVTVVAVAAGVVLGALALGVPLPEERGEFLPIIVASGAMALVYASVGAVVATRRPENPIGWLFGVIGVTLALVGVTYGYGDYSLYGGADLPGARLAAWATTWLFVLPVFVAPCFVLFLFPDGRPPSPRWRHAYWLFGALTVVALVGSSLEAGRLDAYPDLENPLGLGGTGGAVVGWANTIGEAVGAPAVFLVALASLVFRYRRASGVTRLQIKWVAYAATLMVACFAASFLVGERLPLIVSDVLFLAGFAGFGAIAVAAGTAILRHRLYEIDVVINRTLVYASVTAVLAGTYVGLVLLFQLVLRPVTAENGLAVALSTLAVAALFRPARSRIQALVDRRFYRRKYDAERTLERFSVRLRDEVELVAVREELTGVVRETMQPAHVSLWLRDAAVPVTPAVTIPRRSPSTRESR